jgi:5-methyltetrahydrofolate--homocysteine methyltransferase
MKAGMPDGVCVEQWTADNPAAITDLQRRYAEAGSGAVMAPTFGANPVKLAKYGLGGKTAELNARLVAISRAAVGEGVLVAGDISPTGLFAEPFGDMTFAQLEDIFSQQATALRDAGADYIALETMMDLTEPRAALAAAKKTGLAVTATLTVEKNGLTLSGGTVTAALVTLAAMGAAAVGVNCSEGPETVLKALGEAAEYVNIPLVAKPNAGLPLEGKQGERAREYAVGPEEFASYAGRFLDAGAGLIGGCCGSGPEHIAALKKALEGRTYKSRGVTALREDGFIIACSEHSVWRLRPEELENIPVFACSGELADDLEELGDSDAAARIELGGDGAEEFIECSYLAKKPLVLSSASADELGSALAAYRGRALVAGDCGAPGLEEIAALYGAAVV